ncbi:MAG: glycosyltransferase family 39 protein [Pseudoxanthomonas sp.]
MANPPFRDLSHGVYGQARARQRSRDTWLLALTALLVLGAGLGLRDPWPADEPRFALVAKQMVESGNWLFPHRGVELYSDKPPLLMWMQAALLTVTGSLRISFLLPSLLAALLTLWCVYDLGRRLWTRQVGLYAAWAVLLTFQFTFQAKKAQIDPLVTGLITLANYGLLRHLLRGPDWRMWTLGWFAAGLGVITKGVGVIALLMVLPAGIAALRGWPSVRVHARSGRFWLGPAAFFLAILLWLVPMVTVALTQAEPEYRAYLKDILLRQTAKRYSASWDHQQPIWYHFKVMATMWLPPMLGLPWAIPAWRRRLRRRDARYLLLLAWWGLVVLFFSIPHGKRDVYILPALPMACLALAPLLPGILRQRSAKWLALGLGCVLALAPLGVGLSMLLGDPRFESRFLADRGLADAAPFAWLMVAVGMFAAGCVLWFGRRRAVLAVLWSLGGVWVLYGLVGYGLLNDASSARGVMRAVNQRLGPDVALGLVAWKEQNLLMTQSPTTTFGFKMPFHQQLARGLAWQAQSPTERWLLVQELAMPACIDRHLAEKIGISNRRSWWLVPMAARVGCPAAPSVGTEMDDGED